MANVKMKSIPIISLFVLFASSVNAACIGSLEELVNLISTDDEILASIKHQDFRVVEGRFDESGTMIESRILSSTPLSYTYESRVFTNRTHQNSKGISLSITIGDWKNIGVVSEVQSDGLIPVAYWFNKYDGCWKLTVKVIVMTSYYRQREK